MNSVVRQLHEQGTDVVMVDTGNSYEGLCEYLGGTLLSIVGGPENVDRLFSIDSSISTRAGMPKGTAMPCISATCRMKLLPTVWVWHRGHPLNMYAHDGKANTHEMYDGSGCSSPAAVAVFSIWRYGQSAYIPSVAQMRLLYAAKPYINDIIRQCGGNPLPDEAEEVWYWTSTEVAGQETSKAWLYSIGSGAVQETPKLRLHKVRPIITLNE